MVGWNRIDTTIIDIFQVFVPCLPNRGLNNVTDYMN